MIKDKNVAWLEKKVYIPAWMFQTFRTIGPSGGATDLGGIDGTDVGAPVMTEIGASGITGLEIGAAGDMVATVWDPYEVDIRKALRFRVVWTQTSVTATDTIDWILTYLAINAAETTALVTPVTALTTPIPLGDASSGVAARVQWSDFGQVAGNTLVNTTELLAFRVEADAIGTFSANEPLFLGLEIRYTPRRCQGPERNLRGAHRLALTTPLGVTPHVTQEG